eukprot:TRINITY_DN3854_c0_g1_i1.p3 TRINITY_DN3854_c0_g1~~TRINITY_DN3854_c0_g1_i1.p3  ORF type:complete len:209 (-),score=6.12 TRINITY_DN3854_c0_g1_i1:208-834(-)
MQLQGQTFHRQITTPCRREIRIKLCRSNISQQITRRKVECNSLHTQLLQQKKVITASLKTLVNFWGQCARLCCNFIQQRLQTPVSEEVNSNLRKFSKNARFAYSMAPFAAVTSGADTLILVTKAVASFIKLYLLLLFLRVLLSWFPNFEWDNQPWLALRQVTDPYLNLFRGIVPPLLGSIDFTPLVGFMILQFLGGLLDVTDENEDVW